MNNPLTVPFIKVEAENLPRAWEISVMKCLTEGIEIKTEYDKEEDPPSLDCSMVISVTNPFNEPRIHKCIPCGIGDLTFYSLEVTDGIHDDWIAPEEGKWSYTYHQRLKDQIPYIVDTLVETPYSRRAQAITWDITHDTILYPDHTPCLQRLWFRIINDELIMSASMRSNDAFKAAFMNMYAFTNLQKDIAKEISKRIGYDINVGQYNHVVDSYHIYGSYFGEIEKFVASLGKRKFEDRVYYTEEVQFFIDEINKQWGKE